MLPNNIDLIEMIFIAVEFTLLYVRFYILLLLSQWEYGFAPRLLFWFAVHNGSQHNQRRPNHKRKSGVEIKE